MVLRINTARSGNYKMIRYFLKLKSWELFLLLVLPLALTYLMQFKFTVSLIGNIAFFVVIVVFSWLYSIGKWANQHLPKDQQKKPDSLHAWIYRTASLYIAADPGLLSNPEPGFTTTTTWLDVPVTYALAGWNFLWYLV